VGIKKYFNIKFLAKFTKSVYSSDPGEPFTYYSWKESRRDFGCNGFATITAGKYSQDIKQRPINLWPSLGVPVRCGAGRRASALRCRAKAVAVPRSGSCCSIQPLLAVGSLVAFLNSL